MKTCSKCRQLKEFSEFGKSKQVKDGYKSACKECLRQDNRLYYNKNLEKESQRKKKMYERDKDRIIARQLEYYANNKEYRAKWVKNKRQEEPEVFKEYKKQFSESHPGYNSKYRSERLKTDPLFKLQSVLRTRTGMIFKYHKFNKNNKFKDYIGCSLNELKDHLEKQFQPGMTWKNHTKNGWHIDHIIPLSSANTEEELYKLCHYTNLQPLWAIDNLRKSDKI